MTATILGIGTANPANCIYQKDFTDFYFSAINDSDHHLAHLRPKVTHLCEKSGIKKRYFHLTKEILKENPTLCDHKAPSLNLRQNISAVEIPKLGEAAAIKAIQDWGQSKSRITHLIFSSIQAVHMPGADLWLTVSLGLNRSVNRVMIYHQGCYISVSALRLAKDIAESNHGSRVLVVTCDMILGCFRGPNEEDFNDLYMQTTMGDGAAALIVGVTDTIVPEIERPLFKILSRSQFIIPDSENVLQGHVKENGFFMEIKSKVPGVVASTIGHHIENFLNEMVKKIPEIDVDRNSMFWVVQATAKPVLDRIETELKLEKDKLEVSREVWREFGYLQSSSTLFVLEKVMKKMLEEKTKKSEFGIVVGFGAGITLEALVLQSLIN